MEALIEHPLRKYRAKAKLTLEDVAARARTTKETVSRIERWERQPSLSMARRLSEATGLPLEEVTKPKAGAA